LQNHALLDTFFKSAVLTAVPLRLGDFARTIGNTRINSPILYSPFKKTFTPANKFKYMTLKTVSKKISYVSFVTLH
jgi:hypothetical protein